MRPEFELVSRVADTFEPPDGTIRGIGDDAAVLESGRFDLWTTDVLVEGVHFRRDWCSDEAIGWRSLVASLSDIAAMGGRPGPYVASIGLGDDVDDTTFEAFARGWRRVTDAMAEPFEAIGLVGGDTTSTLGATFLSIALLGKIAGDDPILRAGAEPGDRIVLVGSTGASAAGLALLRGELEAEPEEHPELLEAFRRPRAWSRIGAELGRLGLPSAMIDVSDGLAADLGHLLASSDVGAHVDIDALPWPPALTRLVETRDCDPIPWLVGGGEDFALLATVPEERMETMRARADAEDWPMTDIGVIVPSRKETTLVDRGRELEIREFGYEHFRGD